MLETHHHLFVVKRPRTWVVARQVLASVCLLHHVSAGLAANVESGRSLALVFLVHRDIMLRVEPLTRTLRDLFATDDSILHLNPLAAATRRLPFCDTCFCTAFFERNSGALFVGLPFLLIFV